MCSQCYKKYFIFYWDNKTQLLQGRKKKKARFPKVPTSWRSKDQQKKRKRKWIRTVVWLVIVSSSCWVLNVNVGPFSAIVIVCLRTIAALSITRMLVSLNFQKKWLRCKKERLNISDCLSKKISIIQLLLGI